MYELARQIVPKVVAVTAEILDEAKALLDSYDELSACDALHAAVCKVSGATGICSYDDDFDGIRGLKRFEPDQLV